jgi:hypothetical protein
MKVSAKAADGLAANVIHAFRELTDTQFDYWITSINKAIVEMGGGEDEFTQDDKDRAISYWYILMYLMEIYAKDRDPFAVQKGDLSYSPGLISMRELSRVFRGCYKEQTVRRYVSDLKRLNILDQDGRGPDASVKISSPSIRALSDTIKQWVTGFRELDTIIRKSKLL